MRKLWRRLLARLASPPFEGRWTPQALDDVTVLDARTASGPTA